jgi:hypothetical protein
MKALALFLILVAGHLSTSHAQQSDLTSPLTSIPGRGKVKIPRKSVVLEGDLDAHLSVNSFRRADDTRATAITFTVQCGEVFYVQRGGNWTTRLRFYFRIRSANGSVNGFIEGSEDQTATTVELTDLAKCRPIVVRRLVSLPKGIYRIDALIKDFEANRRNITALGFTVD